ncbi:hypothetical protein pb186bvf_007994 [Paramecium bursaria]
MQGSRPKTLNNSLDSIQINIDDKNKKFNFAEQYIQRYTIYNGCNHLIISPNNYYLAIFYHQVMQKLDEKGNRIKINSIHMIKNIKHIRHIILKWFNQKVKQIQQKLKFKNTEIEFLSLSNDSCYWFQNCKLQDYRHFVQLQRIKSILPTQCRAFVFTYSNQIQLLDMEFQNKLFEIQTKNLIDMVYDNINKIFDYIR